MTVFLVSQVVLLGLGVASSLNLGNPSVLHFNVDSEYATSFEDYKPRDYKFEYGVSDPHTGDHKSHWEVRENGVVRGEYSLLEPDGTTRVVQYTADDDGFRAVVKKVGHAIQASYHHQDLHESPIVIPEVPSDIQDEPIFKTYDGNAENYINVIDDFNVASLPNNNHPISERPALNTHIQESIISTHSIAGNEVNHQNYHSSVLTGVGGTTGDQLKLKDNYIPVHQELVHVAEPIPYHEPIHISSIQQQPVYSYESAHPQEHILTSPHIQEPLPYSEPLPIHEHIYKQEHIHSTSSLKELPAKTGLKVEHPHGESSSSFILSTGNPDVDSLYTRHDKGSVIAGGQDSSGWNTYQSPIPYQRFQERSVSDEIEKLVR